MSNPSLPTDLNDWPKDPYELLGVPRQVSPLDLRLAYTHLIRTYKPEQYPEHFRRIREAYDTILSHVKFFGAINRVNEEVLPSEGTSSRKRTDDDGDIDSTKSNASENDPSDLVLPMPREVDGPEAVNQSISRPRRPVRDLQQLWELACSGREQEAYDRLRDLDADPGSEELCIRLYWLLVVAPEVDETRSPHEWLTLGLKKNGLTGPMRELFRREVEADPEIALKPESDTLLHVAVKPSNLFDFVLWRWQAAARLLRWESIHGDVQHLRERVLAVDEEAWVRLLLLAIDQVAWADISESLSWMKEWCQEIDSREFLHTSLESDLVRLDYLRLLAQSWRRLGWKDEFSASLRKLVPISWSRPFSHLRVPLVKFLRKIALEPAKALKGFDSLQKLAPAVLSQFGNMLKLYQQHLGDLGDALDDDRPASLLDPIIVNFLANNKIWKVESFRKKLLDFCIEEAVTPEQVADVLSNHVGYCEAVQTIQDDWPLRYVVWAHRLFWA